MKMKKQHEPAYGPKIRSKWYFLVEKAGKGVQEVCDLYSIARKTYYKWRAKDLGNRSYRSRQTQPNTKLTSEIKLFIETQKLRTNYGPKKMKRLIKRKFNLSVSTTIIYRFYKRKGLIRRPQKRLPWYTPLKEPVVVKKPGGLRAIRC